MPRKILTAVLVAIAASGFYLPVTAEPSAEDAQKYRVSLMTTLRGHIGAASMIVRGLVEDDGYLQAHADGLANGVKEMHRVFQEGSAVGESEALPVIWEDPEGFKAALEKSEAATKAFQEAAASGDRAAIGAAFRDVGMSCRGCHDNYRVAN